MGIAGLLFSKPAGEVNDVVPSTGPNSLSTTGNKELDEVLEGSTSADGTTKGLETPSSKEDFEDELRDIPGAEVIEHGGPGIEATLPDGTKVSTYPERDSTGHPGYQVTSPDGKITHKGSLVGSD